MDPAENGQPRLGIDPTGAVSCCPDGKNLPPGSEHEHSAKGLVSRILFYAVIPLGAALPRALISDLPGGFGHCLTPVRRRPVAGGPEQPFGAGPAPGANFCSESALPSLFGLAPCGVYPAAGITAGAVRSYRTFSPLPGWSSRQSPFGPVARAEARAPGGMSSLWH